LTGIATLTQPLTRRRVDERVRTKPICCPPREASEFSELVVNDYVAVRFDGPTLKRTTPGGVDQSRW